MRYIIVILGVAGVSLSPVFRRFSTAPSLILAFYRVSFAALLLTPYMFCRGKNEWRQLTTRDGLLCICSGIFLGLHFSAYFESLRLTSIAVAAVLVNMEAIFVSLGQIVILRSRLSKRAWKAVLLAFAGSIVVAMADIADGGAWKGNLLALTGAVMGAAYTLTGTVCRRNVSNSIYTYLLYLSSAVTMLVISLGAGLRLSGYEPINIVTTLGMAVFCTLMGHSVYSWGLKELPASFVSTAKLMEPVFAAVWGGLLFHEYPSMWVIAGGAVVLLGVLLYSTENMFLHRK